MKEEKAIEQMTNEELLEAFAEQCFEYGAETDREEELKAEILRRTGQR